MTDRPALALPPEIAQQVTRQAQMERAGRQLLESLACAIYTNLAAQTIRERFMDEPEERAKTQAIWAQLSVEAAFPMAAHLGWHFQAAPPDRAAAPAPEHAT